MEDKLQKFIEINNITSKEDIGKLDGNTFFVGECDYQDRHNWERLEDELFKLLNENDIEILY